MPYIIIIHRYIFKTKHFCYVHSCVYSCIKSIKIAQKVLNFAMMIFHIMIVVTLSLHTHIPNSFITLLHLVEFWHFLISTSIRCPRSMSQFALVEFPKTLEIQSIGQILQGIHDNFYEIHPLNSL